MSNIICLETYRNKKEEIEFQRMHDNLPLKGKPMSSEDINTKAELLKAFNLNDLIFGISSNNYTSTQESFFNEEYVDILEEVYDVLINNSEVE